MFGRVFLAATACLFTAAPVGAWGDRTHPAVVRLAIETLPGQAASWFGVRAERLAAHSNEPDSVLRAREAQKEAVRHYINLDAYMQPPFIAFPRTYRAASRWIGKRQVERNGILPWVILRVTQDLRNALREGNDDLATQKAGYLAHYVADAFQPLHLTRNHDGQLSGANGLHKRFENGLVDRRIRSYTRTARTFLQPARPLKSRRQEVFEAMFRTYEDVQSLIEADAWARKQAKVGSRAYYDALAHELGERPARQLAAAATMLGSLWLTAWETQYDRLDRKDAGG